MRFRFANCFDTADSADGWCQRLRDKVYSRFRVCAARRAEEREIRQRAEEAEPKGAARVEARGGGDDLRLRRVQLQPRRREGREEFGEGRREVRQGPAEEHVVHVPRSKAEREDKRAGPHDKSVNDRKKQRAQGIALLRSSRQKEKKGPEEKVRFPTVRCQRVAEQPRAESHNGFQQDFSEYAVECVFKIQLDQKGLRRLLRSVLREQPCCEDRRF